MHRRVIAHIHIAGDDAGLGFAPVTAGDLLAGGNVIEAQAVAAEQGGSVVPVDITHTQDVGGGVGGGQVGHGFQNHRGRWIQRPRKGVAVIRPGGLPAGPRKYRARRARHP
ncbi:hypothetical protein D3C71_1824080 [compost metagenome]